MKSWYRRRYASILFLSCLLVSLAGSAKGKEAPRQDDQSLPPDEPKAQVRIRDPFLPGESVRHRLLTPSMDLSSLSVQAILYHPSNPRALIAGQVVGVGDRLYEYVVTGIERDKVSIKRGTRTYDLFLKLSFEHE